MSDAYERMPKIELHVHLEGSIPAEALWSLMQRHGGDAEVPTRADLDRRLAYRDFRHFITTWVWKNRFLRDADDLAEAAEAAARAWARDGIIYSEAHCSPPDFAHLGLSTGAVVAAFRHGLDRVPDLSVRLIVDVVRDFGPQRAERTAAEACELVGLGVVAIGLGGSEAAHPPAPFANAFAIARRGGLHTVAHAGEAAGPDSIRAALDIGAERIGHGIRCLEDPSLVRALAASQVPLEVCPTSNLRTGVVAHPGDHPLRRLVDAGLAVTINSDDPAMFHCTLSDELRFAAWEAGLGRAGAEALIDRALASAFLASDQIAALRQRLDRMRAASTLSP